MKEVREEFTYSMLNYVSQSRERDYCIFICFDHRINPDLQKIHKFLLDDLKAEEKNCFIFKLV